MDKIHVTWGPDAHKLSEGERQAIVDGLIADGNKRHELQLRAEDALKDLPYCAVPTAQLADMYERFLRLIRLGQSSFAEWEAAPKELRSLRSKVFAQADFGAVFAGQWLPRDVQNEVRKKLEDEATAAKTGDPQ